MMITAQEISEATGLPTYEQMKEWYEANAEGRLLILPCKVGDIVWKIVRHRVDVSGYRMEWEWETCIEAVKFSIGMFEAIGKTIFLTREEAEVALKEGAN